MNTENLSGKLKPAKSRNRLRQRPVSFRLRITCWLVIITQVFSLFSDKLYLVANASARDSATPAAGADSAGVAPAKGAANSTAHGQTNHSAIHAHRSAFGHSFSANPSDVEFYHVNIFTTPLMPVGSSTSAQENKELAQALKTFVTRTNQEDVSALMGFLESNPNSRWRAALLLNVGQVYRVHGYISRALDAWEQAWALTKSETNYNGKTIADETGGELIELYGRLGRKSSVEEMVDELKGRNLMGRPGMKFHSARVGIGLMNTQPQNGYMCGPAALYNIRKTRDEKPDCPTTLAEAKSTTNGTSLAQLKEWSDKMDMHMQMAKRKPGAEIPLPAVVNWKSGHFAALIKNEGNRFLMVDSVFEQRIWMSMDAVDDESSGYFLVPEGNLPRGWQTVGLEEANNVWGKGPSYTGSYNHQGADGMYVNTCPIVPPGMAQYNVNAMLASLTVFDTPLAYAPPRGPAIKFSVTYDQYDINDWDYALGDMGPNWIPSYLSYASGGGSSVEIFTRGGGKESYTLGVPNPDSQAIVQGVGVTNQITPTETVVYLNYVRYLSDGSKETYEYQNPFAEGPCVLTSITDAQGNKVTLNYESSFDLGGGNDLLGTSRLTSITDAIGQNTTIQYVSDNPTNTTWFTKISQVTDPFGRSCYFNYDTTNSPYPLIEIIDPIGIHSQFAYATNNNGCMSSMTTPYGTNTFTCGTYTNGTENSMLVTDPEGNQEFTLFQGADGGYPCCSEAIPTNILANNTFLNYRNTYYWDKNAMQKAPGDITKAKIYHWLHQSISPNITGHTLESLKEPLESRVFYNYPGQSSAITEGGITNSSPSAIARILDDGNTQLYQYAYSNIFGKVTMQVDPVGRKTLYKYDTNGIDLLQVLQQNGTNQDILKTITYNNQHLPLTRVDAAGQTNFFGYNSHGQLTSMTNALGQTVSLFYDSNGYLTNTVGSLPGSTNSITYDSYGRVFTSTDSSGYTLTYSYDNLNRITKIAHPDGTYEQIVYQFLDPILKRDRRGHWTSMTYDSLRRLRDIRDSLNRVTHFEWCGCGSLESITDPMGKTTTWTRDIEGRPTAKTFPDMSQIQYGYAPNTGRLTSVTDAKNQTTLYSYFTDNNLSQVSYSNTTNTTNVSFTYDTNYNRMLTMVDGTGPTAYGYNPISVPPALGAGRLANVTNPASLGNSVISYQYDALGRVTKRAIDGVSVQTTFDTLGRVSLITNVLGTFSNSYVGDTFRLSSVSYPNGQGSSFSFFDTNNDLRLQTILNTNSSNAVISRFDYTYDADGQIQTWTRQADTTSTNTFTFNYDPVDQLLGAVLAQTGVATNILNQYVYSYDSSGNRTGQQIGSTATGANYNNLNQLYNIVSNGVTQFSGNITKTGVVAVAGVSAAMTNGTNFASFVTTTNGTNLIQINAIDQNLNTAVTNYQLVISNNGVIATLVYDLNGNLVTNMTATATNTYEWDGANRLTAINEAGTNRSEFTYDGVGRRVKIVEKTNNVAWSTKTFVWCGTEICEERNSAGTTVTRRFFGQGEQISGTNYYFTRDHLGSVREMTDTNGTLHARYDYDPYGVRTKVSGNMDADFAFTGHYTHLMSGLNLTLFRVYAPATGRWISRDPLTERAGINLYAYLEGNPLRDYDSLGLGPSLIPPFSIVGQFFDDMEDAYNAAYQANIEARMNAITGPIHPYSCPSNPTVLNQNNTPPLNPNDFTPFSLLIGLAYPIGVDLSLLTQSSYSGPNLDNPAVWQITPISRIEVNGGNPIGNRNSPDQFGGFTLGYHLGTNLPYQDPGASVWHPTMSHEQIGIDQNQKPSP